MEKKINMPKLAPEMESGVLCAWLKEEGDTVAAGEPLFEIETNKVVNQVEATVSGVLKQQLAEEGDTVARSVSPGLTLSAFSGTDLTMLGAGVVRKSVII